MGRVVHEQAARALAEDRGAAHTRPVRRLSLSALVLCAACATPPRATLPVVALADAAPRQSGDGDGDGIADSADACPRDPEDRDGFEDDDGCPDADNDKDRIPDVADRCPNEPETYNGFEDDDGCPDRGTVIITENVDYVLEHVYFLPDSAAVPAAAKGVLDAVAAVMRAQKDLDLVEVDGHASKGEAHARTLSEQRADAVIVALVQRGVARHRLRAQGWAEHCTLGAPDKDRRVEFRVLLTGGVRSGVSLGCPAAAAHGIKPAPY